jgi:hypothetical protein
MKKLYKILICLFLTLFYSCGKSFSDKSIIYEGKGVDDYEIGELSPSQIKYEVNGNYKLINHQNYSTEINYEEEGISFYYLRRLPIEILSISFNKNFKGKTSRGFDIKKFDVTDMIKIYGKPRWNQFKNSKLVYAHYDKIGIYFEIKGLENLPNEFNSYTSNDLIILNKIHTYFSKKYKNQKIEKINIGIPNSAY